MIWRCQKALEHKIDLFLIIITAIQRSKRRSMSITDFWQFSVICRVIQTEVHGFRLALARMRGDYLPSIHAISVICLFRWLAHLAPVLSTSMWSRRDTDFANSPSLALWGLWRGGMWIGFGSRVGPWFGLWRCRR